MDVPAPSGRRDNGLPSADWGALVDLDPRLSEALLSSLASADVPAFVEPAAGANAWTRAAQLPDRPLHRLWVDPAKADTARSVVAREVEELSALLAEREPGATAHGFVQAVPRTAATRVLRPPELPGPPGGPEPALPSSSEPSSPVPSSVPSSVPAGPGDRPAGDPPGTSGTDDTDAVWRQIVADFERESDVPVPPWPVSEDVEPRRSRLRPSRQEQAGDEPQRRRRTDRPADPPADRPADRPADLPADPVAPLPGWVEPEALEDDGHYVPPPPPPVPRLSPRTLAAALTLLAGLLLMIDPGLLLQPETTGWRTLGVLLTVGGAAALVWLMRDTPPGGSGPDDGAVV